jgi:hypothetical protein
MSIVAEPDTSRQRKKPQDYSFFDYESQLPQDRLQQQPATAPEVPKPQPQERTAEQILKDMFAFTPKRPTYDPARPEEMKRLAKASAIGKGLNVVGDIIGLSAGANVNKRQDDNKEERYLNSMYNYLDDYTRRLDNWNYQDFANKMRLGQMQLQQANRTEDRAFQQKSFEADQDWKKLGFTTEQAWKEANFGLDKQKAETDAEYKQRTLDERERSNRQREAAAFLRAQNTGQTTAAKPYPIYDDKGNTILLEPNEQIKIMGMILDDVQLTDKEMELLSPSMGEPMSTNTMNMLIQKYAFVAKPAREYIEKKYSSGTQQPQQNYQVPQNWQAPAYNGPVRNEGTPVQPTAQPQIQQPISQPRPEPAPKSTTQQAVDTTAINNKYQGIDITNGTPYQIAVKIAEQQGIININQQPTSQQLAKVKRIEEEVKQDAETLRAARVAEGVGITNSQSKKQSGNPFDF